MAPGGYFHFQPGEMYMGGGMWHPEPAQLAAWRAVRRSGRRDCEVLDDPAFVETFGQISRRHADPRAAGLSRRTTRGPTC